MILFTDREVVFAAFIYQHQIVSVRKTGKAVCMKKIILSTSAAINYINCFSCGRERGIDLRIQENAANLLNTKNSGAQHSEAEY